MQMICCNLAALAVASLYYSWRAYTSGQLQQELVLRERVAHLLWAVAEQAT